jgi:double zinc ribbon protein
VNTNKSTTCVSCGEAVAAGSTFCRSCGARQDRQNCAACGEPLAPGASFCRSCGAPVVTATPPPPTPTPERTAARPTPPPPPPPPPPERERRGSWRTPILIAGVILLLGAGAAAAIVLTGAKDEETPATVAAKETAPAEEESEPGAAEEPADSGPAEFPPVGRPEMEEEIEGLLRAFHVEISKRNFQGAWALLSARKRRKFLAEEGFEEWKDHQTGLSTYLTPAGLRARIDALEDGGVARVMVTGMGWGDSGASCSEWSGLTWVKYEDGVWAYDPGYSTTPARRREWEPRKEELLGELCY